MKCISLRNSITEARVAVGLPRDCSRLEAQAVNGSERGVFETAKRVLTPFLRSATCSFLCACGTRLGRRAANSAFGLKHTALASSLDFVPRRPPRGNMKIEPRYSMTFLSSCITFRD